MTVAAIADVPCPRRVSTEDRWEAFQRALPPRGCELEVSILFADTRGSTALAERLSPTAFSELMRGFYSLAGQAIADHGGVVEKLVGDGVVALFIPGVAGSDHARRAIDAAHALLGAMDRDADGTPRPPAGVAVHTGRVWLGVIPGPHGRRDLTALGDAVNVAAHLCAAAAPGEVAVSEASSRASGQAVAVETSRLLRLKRRRAPIAARFYVPRRSRQSLFRAPVVGSKSLRYSPYPSSSSFSTGMNRSAAELMQ